MPSLFPGMDPYLEHVDQWHGFHKFFCPKLAEAIVAKVPETYYVTLGENVYVHELPAAGGSPEPTSKSVYADLPTVDVEKLPFIEIRDRQNRKVITVVELLSPTNKTRGIHRDQYLAKRARLMGEAINLVEIDLLRAYPRMPVGAVPQCDYIIMVARRDERPRTDLWPVRMEERLPEIPIPLTGLDGDVRVDLQSILHAVYDAAGCGRFIYGLPIAPPLSAQRASWANQFVPQQ